MRTPTLALVYPGQRAGEPDGRPAPAGLESHRRHRQHPEKFEVKLLQNELDSVGEPVDLDYIIDRTEEPTRAIYLASSEREN